MVKRGKWGEKDGRFKSTFLVDTAKVSDELANTRVCPCNPVENILVFYGEDKIKAIVMSFSTALFLCETQYKSECNQWQDIR